MDTIFIKNLTFNAIIGIYPHEREHEQPMVIDLEMANDIREAAHNNDLNASINYAAVSEAVISFCCQAEAELLETLAENLSAYLMKEFNIPGLRLHIGKPMAVPEAELVGVKISRGVPF